MRRFLKTIGWVAVAAAVAHAGWSQDGSTWTGAFGDYVIQIDAKKAGKVVVFQFKGIDVIRPGAAEGAFFWPAPQHGWVPKPNWPPPGSFTDSTYAASVAPGGELLLVGPSNPQTKLRVTKRYLFDAAARSLSIQYATTNTATDTARHFAPWEISRGFSGSLLFFPKATGFRWVNPAAWNMAKELPLTREDSIAWYQDDTGFTHNKFYRDGAEGWLAQLKDSLLFVKAFPDVDSTKFAPWESDVEGYTNGQLIENEILGPWTAIQSGDSLVWNVRWTCSVLPGTTDVRVGSAQLLAAARGLAQVAVPFSRKPRPRASALSPEGRPRIDAQGRRVLQAANAVMSGALVVLPVR